LAVVRVSGPETRRLAGRICPKLDFEQPWHARLITLHTATGDELEHGVAIPYRQPSSYTGEDMLELMIHGSPHLVETVIEAFLEVGARVAEPGEFTRRAVANGKMDLLQAEGVRDLIASDTAAQARNARHQVAGRLSERFDGLRRTLVELLARIEAGLDFADQAIELDQEECRRRWCLCRRRILELLETAVHGERIRDGLRVVIAGAPNSGKSTLFNTLLGSERAIVTPQPGTTRDVIEAELEIEGVRVVLVDTAGLRAPSDCVEREGVGRTRAAAASAQIVIQLWPADDDRGGPPPVLETGVPTVLVRSKADLLATAIGDPTAHWIPVSCVTGSGLATLRGRLRELIRGEVPENEGEVAIAQRHRRALERAAAELEDWSDRSPELAAEAVRWALHEIETVTGRVSSQEVLDEVFRTFCIGK
jgi:tRNA modification GTPase